MKANGKHGGARHGSGRKPLDADATTVPVTIKMSTLQKAKLQRLGGARWIRDRIDKAKEPRPQPNVLYHATTLEAANAIDARGFRDARAFGSLRGVFFSDRPLSAADGVARSCDVLLQLQVPAGVDLHANEIIESGRPADAYREWLLPAAMVNAWPCSRYEEPED